MYIQTQSPKALCKEKKDTEKEERAEQVNHPQEPCKHAGPERAVHKDKENKDAERRKRGERGSPKDISDEKVKGPEGPRARACGSSR